MRSTRAANSSSSATLDAEAPVVSTARVDDLLADLVPAPRARPIVDGIFSQFPKPEELETVLASCHTDARWRRAVLNEAFPVICEAIALGLVSPSDGLTFSAIYQRYARDAGSSRRAWADHMAAMARDLDAETRRVILNPDHYAELGPLPWVEALRGAVRDRLNDALPGHRKINALVRDIMARTLDEHRVDPVQAERLTEDRKQALQETSLLLVGRIVKVLLQDGAAPALQPSDALSKFHSFLRTIPLEPAQSRGSPTQAWPAGNRVTLARDGAAILSSSSAIKVIQFDDFVTRLDRHVVLEHDFFLIDRALSPQDYRRIWQASSREVAFIVLKNGQTLLEIGAENEIASILASCVKYLPQRIFLATGHLHPRSGTPLQVPDSTGAHFELSTESMRVLKASPSEADLLHTHSGVNFIVSEYGLCFYGAHRDFPLELRFSFRGLQAPEDVVDASKRYIARLARLTFDHAIRKADTLPEYIELISSRFGFPTVIRPWDVVAAEDQPFQDIIALERRTLSGLLAGRSFPEVLATAAREKLPSVVPERLQELEAEAQARLAEHSVACQEVFRSATPLAYRQELAAPAVLALRAKAIHALKVLRAAESVSAKSQDFDTTVVPRILERASDELRNPSK